ncbi:Rne/Rng family ribonuclease [Rhizobium sp. LjRoot254]|uniref:Rne/Rng family ribonuclease n=1 Tax=Rhizobium sp. LjRoot254 TaxID=3342297 RepID=UPI003ECC7078
MADKMLIDASHAEETRVVVVRGNRIEEFDFESQHKKQIRGNIYLAKVTRVEPSLQAAFVDYGGNRHGFLAFAEIHPDYYQIPLADRQALLRAEAEEHRRDDDFEPAGPAPSQAREEWPVSSDQTQEDAPQPVIEAWQGEKLTPAAAPETVVEAAEIAETEAAEKPKKPRKPRAPRAKKAKAGEEAAEQASDDEGGSTPPAMAMAAHIDSVSEDARRRGGDDDDDDDSHEEQEVIESVGAEDAMEEVPDRVQRRPRKQYRIQEVIKRRQILLVQVAKEERGNKGAALTTYLSLAGRYSVLMPNTARGGGISRKITNPQDRKRLKEIARDLEVPQGMGVILRTAGANRTKAEVKRDFEYLMRLWENVRTKTLASTAPCLVYEEGSLIKRSIRDLYNKDISEILVAGEEGYREAKDFMKMLMPSHAKAVQAYRDIHPIFSRAGIEAQLDRMLQPQVTLKSGGYIIINQTEALVAVDVNSGRSTREHSIEDTALQTNLEAAEEVARQLRLRDLAGLVVIDFIDMEEKRNNRHVEKRLKDHLKNDRARIQVGRISHFGLLEMSRQRIRASVLESTMQICAHCGGTGHVRSQSSVGLHVLRGVEEFLLKSTTHDIIVHTQPDTALYLLNQKRASIVDYENRFGVSIVIESDTTVGAQHFTVERGEAVENPVKVEQLIAFAPPEEEEDDIPIIEDEDEEEVQEKPAAQEHAAPAVARDENGAKKKKRRRRRRGGNRPGGETGASDQAVSASGTSADEDDDDGDDGEDDAAETSATSTETAAEAESRKRRRRGKRGGRRNREDGQPADANDTSGVVQSPDVDSSVAVALTPDSDAGDDDTVKPGVNVEEKPKRRRTKKAQAAAEEVAQPVAPAPVAETAPVAEPAEETETAADEAPRRRANRGEAAIAASKPVISSSSPAKADESSEDDAGKPKKGGWWQKRGFL